MRSLRVEVVLSLGYDIVSPTCFNTAGHPWISILSSRPTHESASSARQRVNLPSNTAAYIRKFPGNPELDSVGINYLQCWLKYFFAATHWTHLCEENKIAKEPAEIGIHNVNCQIISWYLIPARILPIESAGHGVGRGALTRFCWKVYSPSVLGRIKSISGQNTVAAQFHGAGGKCHGGRAPYLIVEALRRRIAACKAKICSCMRSSRPPNHGFPGPIGWLTFSPDLWHCQRNTAARG